jgi:hypothetical protein
MSVIRLLDSAAMSTAYRLGERGFEAEGPPEMGGSALNG